MTYRGIVSKGVVILEGPPPAEGTKVEVAPLSASSSQAGGLADHPAIGIWKDRKDLPEDPIEASKVLREQLMRPGLGVVRAY